MSAILQRAGRCARYKGEEGDVIVYRPDDLAPYSELRCLCERTFDALATVDGKRVDFAREQDLISVHNDYDLRMLDALEAQQSTHWWKMQDVMDRQELGYLADLIRQDDSRRLFIHGAPGTETNPYRYESFSIYRGTLFAQWRKWEQDGLLKKHPWLLCYPREIEMEVETDRRRLGFEWKPVRGPDDLKGHVVFAVNPELCTYDPELGFRFVSGHAPSSPELPSRRGDIAFYGRETYVDHIGRVMRALEHIHPREVAWPASRLEARLGLGSGALDRALRFTIACHDAGKLTSGWQCWAHEYQAEIGRPAPDDVVLAHTDHDSTDPSHLEVQRRLRAKKPPHAAEGAAIVCRLVERLFPDKRVGLAALSAIARHHSPATESVQGKLNLHPQARETLAQALTSAGLPLGPSAIPGPASLQRLNFLTKPDHLDSFLIYLFLVRALRLADQLSMEISR